MNVKFVAVDTPEYQQALLLRYELFFKEHNLPKDILFDSQESVSFHAVIVLPLKPMVIAYGRLTPTSLDECLISQMVVHPNWQNKGLGKALLTALSNKAKTWGAKTLFLDARVTATDFYKKSGFEPISNVFASSKTGVLHSKMKKTLFN